MKSVADSKLGFMNFIEKNILLVILLAMVVFVSFVNSNFLTAGNLINILRNMAVTGILACGITMLFVGGEFDLSFGSTLGLTTCIIPMVCGLFVGSGKSITAGALAGMVIAFLISFAIGLINSYFIVSWRLSSMLVTLAMQFSVYGIAGVLTKGFPQYTLPRWFGFFGKGMIASKFPVSVVIFGMLFALFYVVMGHTKFGRTIYTVGGNAEAARLSGVNVKKHKVSIYVIMQLTAFLAGIIFCSQLAGGTPTYGRGIEFNVIAAVIIGGISVYGGAGRMKDSLVGLLFLNVIMNAMTIANLSEYAQYVVRGLIMLAAVLLSELQRIWSDKRRIKLAMALVEKTNP